MLPNRQATTTGSTPFFHILFIKLMPATVMASPMASPVGAVAAIISVRTDTSSSRRKSAGCDRTFKEQVSAVSPARPQLEAALDYLRADDVLVVTKLDRLARSVSHLCEIGKRLDAKGVGLKVLDQAIDTTTPTGRLMFNMLGAIAQFER
jgi:hypothetical protein